MDLLRALVLNRRFRVAVVSGRRLDQIKRLLPIPGLLLAGTYGLEMRDPDGQERTRLALQAVRAPLDVLLGDWSGLLAGKRGFFLEDKQWALAIHARWADDDEANTVLEAARRLARRRMPTDEFRMLAGRRFFEVAPAMANKGDAVAFILDEFPWPGSIPLYIGDDDKDLEAFPVIHARGGFACLVGDVVPGQADFSLSSPAAVRSWLRKLAAENATA